MIGSLVSLPCNSNCTGQCTDFTSSQCTGKICWKLQRRCSLLLFSFQSLNFSTNCTCTCVCLAFKISSWSCIFLGQVLCNRTKTWVIITVIIITRPIKQLWNVLSYLQLMIHPSIMFTFMNSVHKTQSWNWLNATETCDYNNLAIVALCTHCVPRA